MRILPAILGGIILLSLSCSDSTGPGDLSHDEDIVAETIGSEGGEIISDHIELTIPAGAFSTETLIAITTAPEEPFGETAQSETYTIAGLPQICAEELTVSIPYAGDMSGTGYIAVGMDTWVRSVGEMTTTYTLLLAVVDDGMITAQLPAVNAGIARTAADGDEQSVSLTVTAVAGYSPYTTPAGHFIIDYASQWTTLASVQTLGQYLEDAYTKIANLGFSYEGRTNWPISVTVRNLAADTFGLSTSSLWGDNYGYLEFNSLKMDQLDVMRTTAGHEFFHLVQALYDPRDIFSKAKLEGDHLWLDEACAVWIEGKFTDTKDYVPEVWTDNEMAPFNGIVAGTSIGAGYHGYGLSAMIKYIVGEYGESSIIKMYNAIKSGSSPATAVIDGSAPPVEWWQEFLDEYISGDMYDIPANKMVASRKGLFNVASDSDTLETFTDKFPDLSGGLYLVRLGNENLSANSTLTLSVEGDMPGIAALKYRKDPLALEFLETGMDSVVVSDLKSLMDDGWDYVIAMVSNSRSIPPYTDTSDLTLTARIRNVPEPEFNQCLVKINLNGEFTHSFSDRNTSSFFSASVFCTGTLNGTTFTGSRTDEVVGDGTYSSSITIVFDDTFQTILSIDATQNGTVLDSEGTTYENVSCIALNIPVVWSDDSRFNFQIVGDQLDGRVGYITYEYGIVGVRSSWLTSSSGDESCSITVSLYKK